MASILSEFLLNKTDAGKDAVVQAPAFSITKVLTAAAIVVGPIATVIVDKVTKLNFSGWQVVSLAVGLLLFVAITASADVIGRSVAAAAEAGRKAAEANLGAAEANGKAVEAYTAQLIPFQRPLNGKQKQDGFDSPVCVLAAAPGGVPRYLVRPADQPDGPLTWLPCKEVAIG